jgi:hypothetical protein
MKSEDKGSSGKDEKGVGFMVRWNFPSRNNGQIEGFSNPGLAWFKGDPLQALAREICQNSLDAVDNEHEPVRVEFKKESISTMNFPGTSELLSIIRKCADFWKNSHNENIEEFTSNAIKILKKDKIFVLRVSDFNTIGLQGAFDTETITPWVGLVKSTGVNVKNNDTAAGSYGIGKAAAFVNSDLQTVFYRTKDLENNTAAQGVANLMAFSDESYGDADPVRRATGFYGNPDKNIPVEKMDQLDVIYRRTAVGTDLFIPGFHWVTSGSKTWVEVMIGEILENFLMSIHYGQLCVQIENETIDNAHLNTVIARNQKSAKNAYCFNKVLTAKSEDVIEETNEFHGLGTLRLRLIYKADMNKKILVVRKSGMKIADIKGLPKGISYTGILELQGDKINKFFRKMENPQHNSWEPQRHENPDLAKQYKKEVEDWVKETICKKLEEASGEESVIDVGDCFNTSAHTEDDGKGETQEKLLDTTKSIEISLQKTKHSSVKGAGIGAGGNKVKGKTTDKGALPSQRHKVGEKGGKPTERSGEKDNDGQDTVFSGMKATSVMARVISRGGGNNRLVITADENLSYAEIEIVTVGENGKSLPVRVQTVTSGNASVKAGKIAINNLIEGQKIAVDFTVYGNHNYAMGVKVYGN